MNEKDFLKKFIDVTDTIKDVAMGTELRNVEEWDSLSKVNFIAMADADYGVKVTLKQLNACETVADLYELVGR